MVKRRKFRMKLIVDDSTSRWPILEEEEEEEEASRWEQSKKSESSVGCALTETYRYLLGSFFFASIAHSSIS